MKILTETLSLLFVRLPAGLLLLLLNLLWRWPLQLLLIALGQHKLQNLEFLDLGIPLSDVVEEWGDFELDEGLDENGNHKYLFNVTGLIHVRVFIDPNEIVNRYVFISERPCPNKDLLAVFERYGEGQDWEAIEEGYLYKRSDNMVWVNCSVAPVIGVFYSNMEAANQ